MCLNVLVRLCGCRPLISPADVLLLLTGSTVCAGAAEKRIDELIRKYCSEVERSDPLFHALEMEGSLRGMMEHVAPTSASSSGMAHTHSGGSDLAVSLVSL